MGRIIPYIMENKKCLKPPTSKDSLGCLWTGCISSNNNSSGKMMIIYWVVTCPIFWQDKTSCVFFFRSYSNMGWISLNTSPGWISYDLILWMGQQNPINHQYWIESLQLMACLPSINWWFGFRWPIHSILIYVPQPQWWGTTYRNFVLTHDMTSGRNK